MPGENGIGPSGGGGFGTGRRGVNRGNRPGAGPSGNCICPACGEKIPHKRGVPCYNEACPKCGTKMTRE
jgi:hypothetical protein